MPAPATAACACAYRRHRTHPLILHLLLSTTPCYSTDLACPADLASMAPRPPLQPPPPPPPPLLPDTTLSLALTPQPLAWAPPRPPRSAFPRVRGSPAGNPVTVCSECGKQFKSAKALHGHMRCHPERPWRGITPPPQFRLPAPLLLPAPADQFTAVEHEVATALAMLSGGAPLLPTDQYDAAACEAATTLVMMAGDRAGKGEKRRLASPSRKESGDRAGKGKKRRLASLNLKGSGGASTCKYYECDICHRWFATGQALGGHMRSHREATVARATASNCSVLTTTSEESTPNLIDLINQLPPPSPNKNEQQAGGSTDAMLDLKLGY